jgi:hypothetical protein
MSFSTFCTCPVSKFSLKCVLQCVGVQFAALHFELQVLFESLRFNFSHIWADWFTQSNFSDWYLTLLITHQISAPWSDNDIENHTSQIKWKFLRVLAHLLVHSVVWASQWELTSYLANFLSKTGYLLPAKGSFLAWFILVPEDVGDMFFRNVCRLWTDYSDLYCRRSRKYYSS